MKPKRTSGVCGPHAVQWRSPTRIVWPHWHELCHQCHQCPVHISQWPSLDLQRIAVAELSQIDTVGLCWTVGPLLADCWLTVGWLLAVYHGTMEPFGSHRSRFRSKVFGPTSGSTLRSVHHNRAVVAIVRCSYGSNCNDDIWWHCKWYVIQHWLLSIPPLLSLQDLQVLALRHPQRQLHLHRRREGYWMCNPPLCVSRQIHWYFLREYPTGQTSIFEFC